VGKVDLDDFWVKLFTTDGIFDITPFLPKESILYPMKASVPEN